MYFMVLHLKKKSTIMLRKSHKQITDLTEMHKFVAKLWCYKKTKNYQRMHKMNVYSTFVIFPDSSPNVTWAKTTEIKISLMLSNRETNKLI